MAITVFLIDEYGSMLTSLRWLLETQPDLVIAGAEIDTPSTDGALAYHQPDVVVLNLRLPIYKSLDAVRRIRSLCPFTEVISLGWLLRNSDVHQALAAGVQGFVSYEAITDELAEAIRAVNTGERYVSKHLLEGTREPQVWEPMEASTIYKLFEKVNSEQVGVI